MASGKRIDDHGFWAGGKSKGSYFPEGAKSKHMREGEGAGHVGSDYSDTEEKIERDQDNTMKKLKSHQMKPGYRY